MLVIISAIKLFFSKYQNFYNLYSAKNLVITISNMFKQDLSVFKILKLVLFI